jgi:hypothetical protein
MPTDPSARGSHKWTHCFTRTYAQVDIARNLIGAQI